MTAAVRGKLPGTGPGLVRVQSARLGGPTQATLGIMRQRSGQNFLPLLTPRWPPPASVPCCPLGTRVALSYICTAVCSCSRSLACVPAGTKGRDSGGRRQGSLPGCVASDLQAEGRSAADSPRSVGSSHLPPQRDTRGAPAAPRSPVGVLSRTSLNISGPCPGKHGDRGR